MDAAWVCAAERDVEREEDERRLALARSRRLRLPGKFAREADDAQLERELRAQRLEWRRAVERRRERQLERRRRLGLEPEAGGCSSNNREASPSPRRAAARGSVYTLENQRLQELLADRRLLERANKWGADTNCAVQGWALTCRCAGRSGGRGL